MKLLIIDGNNMVNRAFYAVPKLTDSKGRMVNAVKGSINILMGNIHDEKPTHIIAAFDAKAPTFRHKAYPEYKATRSEKSPELIDQIGIVQDLFAAMGIKTFAIPGVEADDIAGTVAKYAEKQDFEVCILSGDKDMLQLASDKVLIKMPKQGSKYKKYDTKEVMLEFGFEPLSIIDYKALMGDVSDNIKGVPKIGEKTAQQLVANYGTIENLYNHLEDIQKPSVKKTLEENKDSAVFSKKLVTIRTNMQPTFSMDSLILPQNLGTQEALSILKEYDINPKLLIS